MGDFLKYISDEWSVISAAPLTFVILGLLMAGVLYFVLTWYYSGQLETLKGRIDIRDDQIEDYKAKLNGATPEEAKARMDRLQGELDSLKPRQLGADKRQKIVAAASARPKGRLEVGNDMSCADSAGYKGELVRAFQDAGWTVIGPSFLGRAQAPVCGLAVSVANLNSQTALETAVIDALRAAQIDFEIEAGGAGEADVRIDVTAKLPSSSSA